MIWRRTKFAQNMILLPESCVLNYIVIISGRRDKNLPVMQLFKIF